MEFDWFVSNDCSVPKQGGTWMWCETCHEETPCKAIPVPEVEQMGWSEKWQSGYFTDLPELHFFKRGRECTACEARWVTYEVDDGAISHYLSVLELQDRAAETLQEAQNLRKEVNRALARLKKQFDAIGEDLPDLKDK